jgi:quercetin dioxygenase-like cupin family protein
MPDAPRKGVARVVAGAPRNRGEGGEQQGIPWLRPPGTRRRHGNRSGWGAGKRGLSERGTLMKSAAHSTPAWRGSPGRLLGAAALLVIAVGAMGAEMAVEPTFMRSSDLKWGAGPPSLPPGARLAVLQGNPAKAGPFTIRAKLPAGYKIPAHWHPTDENVTVVSGTFFMGMGDKLNPAQGKSMPAGSFISLPAKCHHFAWTTKPAIIQVHAMGPFEVTYINPADDPRNRK